MEPMPEVRWVLLVVAWMVWDFINRWIGTGLRLPLGERLLVVVAATISAAGLAAWSGFEVKWTAFPAVPDKGKEE
jgi:hypothetical protein